MKQNIFYTAFIPLILAACSFSAGAKKDLKTGLTYTYKGCTVMNVKLVDAQQIPLTSNEVQLGATVAIAAFGVQNFRLRDGKAYPGCELTIKDSLGKVLATAPDILEADAKDGIATPGPLDLSATFRFSEPFTSGETCYVTARFFDKKNPGTELTASVKVLIE